MLGDPQASLGQDKIPELADMVKDRFERLETAMDLMEANIKMTAQQTAKIVMESVTSPLLPPGSGRWRRNPHGWGRWSATSRPVEGGAPSRTCIS